MGSVDMSLAPDSVDKKQLPSHHVNDTASLFQNSGLSAVPPTWEELRSLSFPLSWYPPATDAASHIRPVKVVKPDWGAKSLESRLEKSPKSECLIATWLGHAGAMVEFLPLDEFSTADTTDKESKYILFDPIFSYRAGPTQYTGTARLRESPCQVPDLPGCNAVFISHNHYDHLDLPTVLAILARFPDTKWFVPLGNKAWFIASGAKEENVVEMDWWQTWKDDFVSEKKKGEHESPWFEVTCVPAQHTSGRTGWDAGSTLWSGWVIQRVLSAKDATLGSKSVIKGSVYHAGDTGYRRFAGSKEVCLAFKEIGKKFGSLNVSFIPIWRGGSLGLFSYAGLRLNHRHMPSALHCSPDDAIEIHKDVKSRNTIAVHFGTFTGSDLESQEAVLEFYKACEDSHVRDLESQEADENGRAGTLDIGGSFLVGID